jgi:hypothetical protein
MELNKQKILTIVMAILLVAAIVYIVINKWQQANHEKELGDYQKEVYQEGMEEGFRQAILEIMQRLSTCQSVPLYAGNTTINVIAVECLQQNRS